MTIELPAELEERVKKRVANGDFESVEACVSHALKQTLLREPVESNGNSADPNETVGEAIQRIFAQLSADEAATLPVDGAAEHDHYIYGLPKKGE